jgi:hypothetical protein
MLGEERYNSVTASIELLHLGRALANKGDQPELLAKGIMASCRARDSVAVVNYYQRLLSKTDFGAVPDSLVQEMDFFIGPAWVEWVQIDWKVSQKPDDGEARRKQLDVGVMMGDSAAIRGKLIEMARRLPDTAKDPDIVARFGLAAGVDPFASRQLTAGWDGCYSPDGRNLVYIRDIGRRGEPDQYLYRSDPTGGGETPIMKATQQFMMSLAQPRYSPDGEWIYFYGSPDREWTPGKVGKFNLYRVKPVYGARPQKLTDADLLPVIPHFNPDGSVLTVKRDVGSTRASVEIVRLTPDRQKQETLSRIGEPVTGATFTPAGDSLIFTTDRGIFRRAVGGCALVVDIPWRGLTHLLLSPDGRHLLVNTASGQSVDIRRTDGKPVFLGRTAVPLGSFDSRGGLLVTRFAGGKRTVWRLNLAEPRVDPDAFLAALK